MKKIGDIPLLTFFGVTLVAFGWLAFFLTIFHLFYTGIILPAAIVFLSIFLFGSIIFFRKNNLFLSGGFLIALLSSLCAILVFSHFTVPTIFSGRDQGSLSLAAAALSQNHSLAHSFEGQKQFFQIYGPGKALNFPGFYYTSNGDLATQFPIGYISWLAAFYSIFGTNGFIVANALSFLLFFLSFYLVSRVFLKTEPSLITLLLVLTSFVFSWFFKFTLSEILAVGIIWFALSQFLFFSKENNRQHFWFFFLSFALAIFIRIETLAFLTAALIIIIWNNKIKNKTIKEIFLKKDFLILLSFLFFALVASFQSMFPFYATFLKGFLNAFSSKASSTAAGVNHIFSNWFYIGRIFSSYTILTYLLLTILAIAYFLRKRKFEVLFPLLILLPSFVYVFNPSISFDHPWMLRRYVFAVVPVCILYSIIFLNHFLRIKFLFRFFAAFLFLTNVTVFLPFISLRENPTLFSQIKDISYNFESDDLILIDRLATGSPWTMMDEPMNILFKKQAVYFFNPADLDKLDTTKFKNIYLIVPDKNVPFYRNSGILDRMDIFKSYSLENFALDEEEVSGREYSKESLILPPYMKNYVYGNIYILKKNV